MHQQTLQDKNGLPLKELILLLDNFENPHFLDKIQKKLKLIKEYYPSSGNIRRMFSPIDDQISEYYPSGELRSKGKRRSPLIYYGKDGNLLSGKLKIFYDDGNIKEEINLLDGNKSGISKRYFPNGNLFCIENYSENQLDGLRVYYSENGDKHGEMIFSKGKLMSHEMFTKNTQEKSTRPYKNRRK
jgi:antitoxin component YwqK of YwqJK toxin-antitoxin module